MAERRMIAKTIIDTDMFLDMPATAQNLYFHLLLRADDDGFVKTPKAIRRSIGASDDDIKLLLAKNYILAFESGAIVIKHWRIHNYIRKDRYKPTICVAEARQLLIDETGEYILDCQPMVARLATIGQPTDNRLATIGQPTDNRLATIGQPTDNRLATIGQPLVDPGKDRLGKVSKEKERERERGNISSSPLTPLHGEKEKYDDEDDENTPFTRILALYENNIHPVSGEIELERLRALVTECGECNAEFGIKTAVRNNAPRIGYIETVARNKRNGIVFCGEGRAGSKRAGSMKNDVGGTIETLMAEMCGEGKEEQWQL